MVETADDSVCPPRLIDPSKSEILMFSSGMKAIAYIFGPKKATKTTSEFNIKAAASKAAL